MRNVEIGIVLQYLQNNGFEDTTKQFSLELRRLNISFDANGFLEEAKTKMLKSRVVDGK